ncbi:hypothetical protein SNE40_004075 [Patella caerulea]
MTTPVGGDLYRTPSKQILVTRDPVYSHPAIFQGQYIGPQPHSYLPLAICVTILNPLIGFVALIFSYMSIRSYKRGDVKYAYKWSNHAFLMGMITIVLSLVLYIAIGFALSPIGVRGGHSY